jgi:hypothetical protein
LYEGSVSLAIESASSSVRAKDEPENASVHNTKACKKIPKKEDVFMENSRSSVRMLFTPVIIID